MNSKRMIAPNSIEEKNRARVIRSLWMLSKDESERAAIKKQLTADLEKISLASKRGYERQTEPRIQQGKVELVCRRAASLTTRSHDSSPSRSIPRAPAAPKKDRRTPSSSKIDNTLPGEVVESSPISQRKNIDVEGESSEISSIDHESSGLFDRAYAKRMDSL